MTFGQVCRQLRAEGCTNLWSLGIWDKSTVTTMTDEYITEHEKRGADYGDWDCRGRDVVFVRRADGERFKVYVAA